MGQPFDDSLGRAEVEVGADTDPFEREIQAGVRKGAELADDEAKQGGKELGDTMAEVMGKRLKEAGPKLARQVEAGLNQEVIRTKTTVRFDKSGNEVGRWVTTVTREIQDAFSDVDKGPTSFFGRFSTGLADAIGAGFNVSGRSPLVALLVPLVGVIVAAVLGALQAVNALIASLTLVPALLGTIGIQAGVLLIAFQGVGTAIEGAFAAKNAKELNEALKGLTPSAQAFVKSLLPLREFFKQIRDFVQENFFSGLGDVVGALRPLMGVLSGLGPVARALGEFFNSLARFFGSPTFTTFVEELMPQIVAFLDRFGPGFVTFLDGITRFAIASLPFLASFGQEVARTFEIIGDTFSSLADDPATQEWFRSMEETWESIQLLITEAIKFVAQFLTTLDQAGGKTIIDTFSEALDQLTFFLASPMGVKAMEGLVNLANMSIVIFTGLLELLLLIIALFEKLGEIAAMITRIVMEGLEGLGGDIADFFTIDLYAQGMKMIQSFIRGIKASIPGVKSVASEVAGIVDRVFPRSPAKEGPLSGKGDPMLAGERIVDRLMAGMQSQLPELRTVSNDMASNIIFGPGAIKLGFEGALPTAEQATQTGEAVGSGIVSILARNTRLAVRTA